MPTSTSSLIDPKPSVIHTSMTSPNTSRGVNKTGMVLRIPGPSEADDDTPSRGDPRRVGCVGGTAAADSTAVVSSPLQAGQSSLDSGSLHRFQRQRKAGGNCRNNNKSGGGATLPHGDVVSRLLGVSEKAEKANDPDVIVGEEFDDSASGCEPTARELVEKCAPRSPEPEIVPVLKRKDSAKDRSRDGGGNRTVSMSEPSVDTRPPSSQRPEAGTKTFTLSSIRATHSCDQPSPVDGATSTAMTATTATTTQVAATAAAVVSRRRISFPADSVLTAVIQDGDTPELVRILTGRHGPGLVQSPSSEGGARRGVDVCQTNHVGLTALHHAVLANNLDAAKLLLCYGADVNAQDVHGFSPLHTAAACGFLPLTTLLLLFGADVFALTLENELPIDVAKDLGIVRVLTAEMTRLVHRELWVTSLVRARAEEAWLLVRKLMACVLLLVVHVFVCVRTSWRKHRKSD